MSEPEQSAPPTFRELALPEPLLRALDAVGYENPSPIQAACIPPLLAGRDMVGQAQTGTGKTAAFALPVLARLDVNRAGGPQALVLAPTRELAIQVAEAFQKYAAHLSGFHVLPIYGGQSYVPQLKGLKRGAHVVVGTPGRVIDHLKRGALDLSGLTTLVLDEADEMLRMGFIEDVETVLEATPPTRQVALFSATMPAPIRRIAQKHLKDPAEITIAAKTTTAANIRQRYWMVSGVQKLDALTRILEVEDYEAMIVFARTKQATEELAQKLEARGLAAAAINGDINQQQRERTIQRLKDGQLDILVATDVAARGLDVERISHVLNYDIPYDTESYVHRIGRTGRAGRKGEAILFVAPRERGMLRAIERATRQTIEPMNLPTVEAVNDQRIARFKQRIQQALEQNDQLGFFRDLVAAFETEQNVPAVEIAAALAHMVQGQTPLLLPPDAPRYERDDRGARPKHWEERETYKGRSERAPRDRGERVPTPRRAYEDTPRAPQIERGPPPAERSESRAPRHEAPAAELRPPRIERFEERPARSEGEARPPRAEREDRPRREERPRADKPRAADAGMETYRVEVGHMHGVKPANIVGAIANEAGLDSANIGRIDIRDDHSLVDLPQGMPPEIFQHLRKVWVSGQRLRIQRVDSADEERPRPRSAGNKRDFGDRGHGRPTPHRGAPGKPFRPGGPPKRGKP